MTARQANPRRVLLDINVLFYDFLFRNPTYGSKTPATHELRNRKQSNNALIYSRQGRLFRTFVADFSIAKFISLMQQVKAPKALQIDEVENLLTKNEVVSLGSRLIKSILEETKNKPLVKDMEDALQFVVAQNNRCTHIITFNKTDFAPFDIGVVLPGKIRSIF